MLLYQHLQVLQELPGALCGSVLSVSMTQCGITQGSVDGVLPGYLVKTKALY